MAISIANNILIIIACVIFARGFFPYKPFLNGYADYHQSYEDGRAAAPFEKVIFMVVDALRSDFVFSRGSGFVFTQGLIADGNAIPFTAHASAPTVTMPRLKAITTGSIPSFLDMILNFAESDTTSDLSTQDTWLSQMKRKDAGNAIMYGDDTWLKLFPTTFARADGTSSFFVSDFTEVDNNVTRHVPEELKNKDWNVMIMHYLGMDHIGHKAGPRSGNMIPKQREMDGIVELIYQQLIAAEHHASTLLVLCGDHGMNEGGNHGGSAPGETSPALVFISPKLQAASRKEPCPTDASRDYEYYRTIEQSDIAPSLAGLLGFPVPINNLGVFIDDLLPLWSLDDQFRLLYENAFQMMGVAKATFPDPVYEGATSRISCEGSLSPTAVLACAWKDVITSLQQFPASKQSDAQMSVAITALKKFCKAAQQHLSSTASNYDTSKLLTGLTISGISFVISLISCWSSLNLRGSFTGWIFTIATVLYALMMFASSYVEEEHQFWLWMGALWFTMSPFRSTLTFASISKSLLPLSILAALRAWNVSGQKHAGEPSISSAILPRSPTLLWTLCSLTLLDLAYDIKTKTFARMNISNRTSWRLSTFLAAQILIFKLVFTVNDSPELINAEVLPFAQNLATRFNGLTNLARATLLYPTAIFAYTIYYRLSAQQNNSTNNVTPSFRPAITALLLIQTRVINLPLFGLFSLLTRAIPTSIPPSTPSIALTTLLLSHASFFALGNTNSISSIDLSNAYNGVASFNITLVGTLLLLATFAGPFYFSVAGLELLRAAKGSYIEYVKLKTLFFAASATAVMAACTVLREHLFVWTVFSPKFLFFAAWFVGWHLLWGGVVEGVVWWVGGV